MVTMKDKELLKLLLKNGWQLSEIKGSHHILKMDGSYQKLKAAITSLQKTEK